jgi:hypothetical protein
MKGPFITGQTTDRQREIWKIELSGEPFQHAPTIWNGHEITKIIQPKPLTTEHQTIMIQLDRYDAKIAGMFNSIRLLGSLEGHCKAFNKKKESNNSNSQSNMKLLAHEEIILKVKRNYIKLFEDTYISIVNEWAILCNYSGEIRTKR